jgi:hypothetical protein
MTEYIEKRKAEAMAQAGLQVDRADLVGGFTTGHEPTAQSDPADQLAKLAALHEQGVLTDEEFRAAKAKVLAAM